MKEASMGAGTIRRAITRADDDEVRRRVARAYGNDLHLGWTASSLRSIGGIEWGSQGIGLLTAQLASERIFPGRDGWEIEARRPLPKPWQWWGPHDATMPFQFLAKIDTLRGCIAQAWPDEALIYREPGANGVLAKWPAASIEAARERAEDECWARGLFGVVEDDADGGPEKDPAAPMKPLPFSAPSGDPAARALRALVSRMSGYDFDGSGLVGAPMSPEQRMAQLGRLADAFVAEMRAERGWVTSDEARTFLSGATAKLAASKVLEGIASRPERDRAFAAESEAARLSEERDEAEFRFARMKGNRDSERSGREQAERVRDEALRLLEAERAIVKAHAAQIEDDRREIEHLTAELAAAAKALDSAREGARGLGVTCQAAQEARDVYQRRAEVAEGKLVYARGEIEAMTDQVARLKQLLSGKVGT